MEANKCDNKLPSKGFKPKVPNMFDLEVELNVVLVMEVVVGIVAVVVSADVIDNDDDNAVDWNTDDVVLLHEIPVTSLKAFSLGSLSKFDDDWIGSVFSSLLFAIALELYESFELGFCNLVLKFEFTGQCEPQRSKSPQYMKLAGFEAETSFPPPEPTLTPLPTPPIARLLNFRVIAGLNSRISKNY